MNRLSITRWSGAESFGCSPKTESRSKAVRCASRSLALTASSLLWLSFASQAQINVKLAWDESLQATNYFVYQSVGTASFSRITNVAVSPTPEALMSGVLTTLVYRWYVTVNNSGGESDPSNIVTNLPSSTPPAGTWSLSAPVLSVSAAGYGQTISGTARLTNGTSAPLVILDGALTSIAPGAGDTGEDWSPRFAPQTVAPGSVVSITASWSVPSGITVGTYKALFAVKTGTGWTDGPQTPFAVSATPPVPTKPAAPTNLRAIQVGSRSIDMTWDGLLSASTEVERSDQAAPFSKISTVPPGGTHYKDSTVRRRTAYVYRVRQVNNVGVSDYSNMLSYSSR